MRVITSYQPNSPRNQFRPRRSWWRRMLGYVFLLTVLVSAALVLAWYLDKSFLSQQFDASADTSASSKPKTSPAPPLPAQPDGQLESILAAWAQQHPERQWSVVAQGLGKDIRFAKFRPTEVYDAASIYKLFLTYGLFQKISLDNISNITVSSQGNSWPLSHCLDVMLRISDNPCAWAVGNYVGWKSINSVLNEAGFTATTLDVTAGHKTDAQDTATLLKGLYEAKLYNVATRDYLINILRKQLYNKGIPAGCSGCAVANKTGDLSFVRHDAAIVEHNSKAYVLVIFTDGASYAQIAELTAQIHNYMKQN